MALSTRLAGYKVLAADWNDIINAANHLNGLTVAGVTLENLAAGTELGATKTLQVYRSGNQSISGSTDPIDWNGSIHDPHNWHSTSVNPNRITVDEDGYYFLNAMFRGGHNNVVGRLYKNGSAITNAEFRFYSAFQQQWAQWIDLGSPGDYYEFMPGGTEIVYEAKMMVVLIEAA